MLGHWSWSDLNLLSLFSPSLLAVLRHALMPAMLLSLHFLLKWKQTFCQQTFLIQSLPVWQDASIQETVCRSRKFQLNDSATGIYFNAIDRMASPSYLPTDQDILQSRVKTTGITETTFKVGELTYKLFDGQRSKWKKWTRVWYACPSVLQLGPYDGSLSRIVCRMHWPCLTQCAIPGGSSRFL